MKSAVIKKQDSHPLKKALACCGAAAIAFGSVGAVTTEAPVTVYAADTSQAVQNERINTDKLKSFLDNYSTDPDNRDSWSSFMMFIEDIQAFLNEANSGSDNIDKELLIRDHALIDGHIVMTLTVNMDRLKE